MNSRETVSAQPLLNLEGILEMASAVRLFYQLADGTPVAVSSLRRLTDCEWKRLVRVIDVQADLGIMAEVRALRVQVRSAGEAAQPGAVDEQHAQQMAALQAEHQAALDELQRQINAVAKASESQLATWREQLDAKDAAIDLWRKGAEGFEKQLLDRLDYEAARLPAEHELAMEVASHKASLDKMEALQRRVSELEGLYLSDPTPAPVVIAQPDDELDAPAPDVLVSEGEAMSIAETLAPVRADNASPEVDETPLKVAEAPGTVAEPAAAFDDEAGDAKVDERKETAPAASSSGGVAPPRAVLDLEAGVRVRLPRSLFGIAEAMLARPCLMAELAQLTTSGNVASTAASVSLLRREMKRQTGAAWAVVRESERYSLARVKPDRPAAAPSQVAKVDPVRPVALKPLTGAVQIEPGDLIGVNIKTGVVAAPLGQYSLDGAVKMARSLDLLKGGQMFGLAHIATVGQWRDAETARNALLMERGRLVRHGIDLYVDKINARLRLEAGAA